MDLEAIKPFLDYGVAGLLAGVLWLFIRQRDKESQRRIEAAEASALARTEQLITTIREDAKAERELCGEQHRELVAMLGSKLDINTAEIARIPCKRHAA